MQYSNSTAPGSEHAPISPRDISRKRSVQWYSLRALETSQGWPPMELVQEAESDGPVFLKANQKEGTVRIRLETGLGEGVLVSGHSADPSRFTPTWGPFPLTFF